MQQLVRRLALLVPAGVLACSVADEPDGVVGTMGGTAGSGGGADVPTVGGSLGTAGALGVAGMVGVAGSVATGGTANVPGAAGSAGAPAGEAGKPSTCVTPPQAADGTSAPEATPAGYGQATTGGGSTKATQVASMTALQDAIDAYSGSGGLVLEYTGKFDFATIKDPCVQHTLPGQTVEIKSKSDITLVGAPGSSANFGIHVAAAASNIIIRNMTIGLTPGGDASDIISIEGMSGGTPKNIWIDHNELFTSLATCPGAGDTSFDGMVDIKKGADFVTVSYNYMHDHHKVSLNGFTDTDAEVRHVTFHHNLFERIGSRTPLQRHGFAHVVNNYFLDVSASCINVRMGGYALIEGNYFEKVVNPVTARDSDEVGFWELKNNNLASAADVAPGNCYGISWSKGNAGTVNATAWTTTAPYPEALGYEYTAQPFQCIHDGLRAAAGAGKGLATLKCK
ncbi:MAG TPA: polysaccharide lyase family 1 protein [Polyangiaceae bacterium]|nr:polysaccharide lyase family 1 protein [Polyangiaceae bacterium]